MNKLLSLLSEETIVSVHLERIICRPFFLPMYLESADASRRRSYRSFSEVLILPIRSSVVTWNLNGFLLRRSFFFVQWALLV